jgi:hypothetical protein
MAKADHAAKLPKRDMRHIFACLAATGHGWIVYRRDARGWDEAAEPRAGIREIVEYDLRHALQFSRDFTAYGRHVPLEKLDDPDVPLRCGALCFLPEGSPGLPDRWASINVDPRGPSYCAPFGKRPDDKIQQALEALHIPPRHAWEAPVLRGPFGTPGLMLRHHVTLRDYLPSMWDEIQARYN